jgi:hypothetical protein
MPVKKRHPFREIQRRVAVGHTHIRIGAGGAQRPRHVRLAFGENEK